MTDKENIAKIKEVLKRLQESEMDIGRRYLAGEMNGNKMGAEKEKAKDLAIQEINQIVS